MDKTILIVEDESSIRKFVKINLERNGFKVFEAMLHRVTGGGLDIAPYIRYLRGKFGELYSL